MSFNRMLLQLEIECNYNVNRNVCSNTAQRNGHPTDRINTCHTTSCDGRNLCTPKSQQIMHHGMHTSQHMQQPGGGCTWLFGDDT